MLPLHTHADVCCDRDRLLKILGVREALGGAWPLENVALDLRSGPPVDLVELAGLGLAGVLTRAEPLHQNGIVRVRIGALRNDAVVAAGDVVRVRVGSGLVSNLYRRGANANTLFATEMCNSRCLMCSQPPRAEDDRAARVREMLDLIPLIDTDLTWLGISGGEPTLLGTGLREVIASCATHLPDTRLHVLSNGRLFADPSAVDLHDGEQGMVTWAIPLYSDTAKAHDYVVQQAGAFDETLNGVYNLAERGHRIEIRMVLHAQTVGRLAEFAEFVYRNLPFVDHVALMGLEPMGYAKVNREILWIDPVDYSLALTNAAWYLADRGIAASVYNVPLCVLPRRAWRLARQSISDWKNAFDPACVTCTVRADCSGFFTSAGTTWKSRAISPIIEGAKHAQAEELGSLA